MQKQSTGTLLTRNGTTKQDERKGKNKDQLNKWQGLRLAELFQLMAFQALCTAREQNGQDTLRVCIECMPLSHLYNIRLKKKKLRKIMAGVMEGTSCGTLCYYNLLHPAALLASSIISPDICLPQHQVPFFPQARHLPIVHHSSVPRTSFSVICKAKSGGPHLSKLLSGRAGAHYRALQCVLSTSESYAATHQAADAQAGAGQWYPRLKNGTLEIVVKAV